MERYLQSIEYSGFQMPTNIKYNKFNLKCYDLLNFQFIFMFEIKQILNHHINIYYHGGSIIYKYSLDIHT